MTAQTGDQRRRRVHQLGLPALKRAASHTVTATVETQRLGDRSPPTPKATREEDRQQPPHSSAAAPLGTSEDQDLRARRAIDLALEYPRTALVDVELRSAASASRWPNQIWVGERGLVLLKSLDTPCDERSALLFA